MSASRRSRFAASLSSGYLLLASNVVFTLVSIPLALRYLSKEQFGLCAVVMQIASYLQLLDLGMTGSLSRILIDYKDDAASTNYGAVIQTGFRVLAIQGLLIAVLGSVASYWLPPLMKVDVKYWADFRWLMVAQCLVLAVGFAGKMFTFTLQAHQRFDMSNFGSIAGFAAQLGAMWAGFAGGMGLYALVVSAAAGTLVSLGCSVLSVHHLRLFPQRGCWGKPSWPIFRELFSYGTDIFLLSVGQMLISASAVPVITRTLGLEAAAVWSVATKLFTLSQQVVYRILDFSSAPLAEMMVRNERPRLHARFRDTLVLTACTAIFTAVGAALCNQSFLVVWVRGTVAWGVENDIAMGLSLLVYSVTRCHIGLAGLTKDIRGMKFLYFIEGLAFVVLALAAAPRFGLAGVIGSGIVTNLLCSGLYGAGRTAEYFGIAFSQPLLGWLKHPTHAFIVTVLLAVALWFSTSVLPALPRLVVNGALFGLAGGWSVWRFGLPTAMRAEIAGLAMSRFRRA